MPSFVIVVSQAVSRTGTPLKMSRESALQWLLKYQLNLYQNKKSGSMKLVSDIVYQDTG